jgi:hypothetical protein
VAITTPPATAPPAARDIARSLRNRSEGSPDVVIFQKNVAAGSEDLAIAWRVIRTNPGDSVSFTYSFDTPAEASDAFGNSTEQVAASNGQLLRVTSGPALSVHGSADLGNQIGVRNDMSQGSIDVQIYRDGRLLAIKKALSPQQPSVFQFPPALWIGVVSNVIEGKIIDSAIIAEINSQLSLTGITDANVTMTGGGGGTHATPYVFSLSNASSA